MATTCPSCGATSAADDYCDSCGAALAAAAGPKADAQPDAPPMATAPAPPAVTGACSNCGAVRTEGDTFCESCGLDVSTGEVPPASVAPTAATGWVATLEADRAYYDSNDSGGVAFPSSYPMQTIPLDGDEVLIGRRSESRGIFPDIDLSGPVADPAVSHRHAVLRRSNAGDWTITDAGSTNGTWLHGADTPLQPDVETAVHEGDHLNVGLFTRITISRGSSGA
jgi:hypothetical protein